MFQQPPDINALTLLGAMLKGQTAPAIKNNRRKIEDFQVRRIVLTRVYQFRSKIIHVFLGNWKAINV